MLRQELYAPGQGFLFEIVAEAEVSEHFKECAVARGMSDIIDITGTDAFLAGTHPLLRRGLCSREICFERRHAGVYDQYRFVISRDQAG